MAIEYDDWGDDFLDGDIDFDMDFGEKKQGFLKSVLTGFLSGVKSNTIGSTDAQVTTVRRALPRSFGTTFDFINEVKYKKERLFTELKENSAEAMTDLAFLSGRLGDALRDKVPNKISDSLETFSEKDFSSWEKSDFRFDDRVRLEGVSDDDVQMAIGDLIQASTALQVESTDVMTRVMNNIGAKQIGIGMQGSSLQIETNSYLKKLLQYQEVVANRNDQIKINLLTRQYLVNAKFYKFMEASQHRLVSEMKAIVKNTGLSDFEKSSVLTESKRNLLDRVLKTTISKVGGMGGALAGVFGKDNREDVLGTLGGLVGDLRNASEMSSGIGLNPGTIIGELLAKEFVDRGPEFFNTKMGKRWIAKFRNRFPEESKKFDKHWEELTRFGDEVSYATKAFSGIAGKHYQETGMMDLPDETYEDYVANLPASSKPIPKVMWSALRMASKTAGGAFNLLAENYQEEQGTQYYLKEKSLATLKEQKLWSIHDSRSLTEEIPALLSEIHRSIEMIRTGEDDAESLRYDYRTSRLTTKSHLNQQVKRMITPTWELDSYASSANSVVDTLDTNKELSEEARSALAFKVARDADKDIVFNPYDYIGMSSDRFMNKEAAAELEAFIKRRFSLTEEDIERTQQNNLDGLYSRFKVPTSEGAKLLHELSLRSESLKNYVPDVSRQIDLARSLGLDDGLKAHGLINVDEKNNRERINQDYIWERLNERIRGKEIDLELEPYLKQGSRSTKVRTPLNTSNFSPRLTPDSSTLTPPPPPVIQEEFKDSFANIIKELVEIKNNFKELVPLENSRQELKLELGEMPDHIVTMNTTLLEIKDNGISQLAALKKLKRVQLGTVGEDDEPLTAEEKDEEREKLSLIDRLRNIVPADLFNKGVEKLLGNRPLVLGGLLGGLAATAVTNPKAAMLLAAGAGAAKLYTSLYSLSRKTGPDENENIYDAEGNEILYAHKKDVGDYYDQVSGKVIKSWRDIKGTVIEYKNKMPVIVASAKQLGEKLFGPDGREVILEGLEKVRAFIAKAFNKLDPFARIRKGFEKSKEMLDQMDVFRAGETTPVLRRIGFENGWYYNEEGDPVRGWREISGPVYDEDGNQLVSLDDLHNGLRTIGGVKIDSLQSMSKTLAKSLAKGGIWIKDHGRQELGKRIGGFDHDVDSNNRFDPITSRLDNIYELLKLGFGKELDPNIERNINRYEQVKPKTPPAAENLTPPNEETGERIRLNSLADKIRRKKEERETKYQEAIVDISESLKGGGEKEGKDKEADGGLLGRLLGVSGKFMLKSITGFFGMIPKAIGLLAGISKGIFGIGKLLTSLLMGRGIPGRDVPVGGKPPKKGRFRRGLGKAGLGAGLMIGGGYGIDWAREHFDVEDGTGADTALDYADTALNVAGIGLTASAVAGMFGTSLTSIAAASVPFLLNPVTLGVAAVGVTGYLAYKYFTSNDMSTQIKLRMAQYGVDENEEELINDILQMETRLENYVTINGGSAGFSKDTPLDEILSPILSKQGNGDARNQTIMWFNGRFKPIYLIYQSAFKSVDVSGLKEYNELKSLKVYQVADQTHRVAASFNPPPYRLTLPITKSVIAMNYGSTMSRINKHLESLKKDYDKTKATTSRLDNDISVKTTEKQIKESKEAGFFKSTWMKMTGDYLTEEDQLKIDQKYTVKDFIADIDISDMLPPNSSMDIVTAFRLAAYGNDENIPWRVEAVLKLERWVEANVSYANGEVRFTGTSTEFYNAFKAMFRSDNEWQAKRVVDWFNYRFLPVYLEWHKVCMINRSGLPSKIWKSLSKTTLFEFARRVAALSVTMNKRQMSIFSVLTSPFDRSRSAGNTTRFKRLLEAIEFEANEAKLIDPVLEKHRTQNQVVIGDNSVDSRLYSESTKKPMEERRQQLNQINFDRVAGYDAQEWLNRPNKNIQDISPAFMRPDFKENFKPVKVDTEKEISVPTEFKPGEDKGVNVPKEQITQLLIQEMVKKGYDDPRVIAQMLALTDYETGGFRKTTENMNYTDPSRAKSIFRKLKPYTVGEVGNILKQGPVALANKVYNGWLGNTRTPNDGWLYRGRGLVHLTGLDNYAKASEDLGVDLVNNPKLVSEDPSTMVKTALWFLDNNPQLKSIQEHGDFNYSARGLNGGKALPGMDKRYSLYENYLKKLQSGELIKGLEAEKPIEDDKVAPTMLARPGSFVNDTALPERKQDPVIPRPAQPTYAHKVDKGELVETKPTITPNRKTPTQIQAEEAGISHLSVNSQRDILRARKQWEAEQEKLKSDKPREDKPVKVEVSSEPVSLNKNTEQLLQSNAVMMAKLIESLDRQTASNNRRNNPGVKLD